jgi:hypothetical protein
MARLGARSVVTIIAVLASMVTTVGCSSARAAQASTLCPSTRGVYAGAAAPGQVAAFEQWSGRPVDCVEDFLASDNWQDISEPTWWLTRWASDPEKNRHHLVLSVPLLPNSGADMATGAAGTYDHYFQTLAQLLVQDGFPDATIRLGWEFNDDSFPWAVHLDGGTASPANFVQYWRHVVRAMRATPGSRFTFDWAVNNGSSSFPPEQAYPGDDVVDIVGIDAYDQVWGPYGAQVTDPAQRWQAISDGPDNLDFWADFARSHGKRIGLPEWGLIQGGHGFGDNPYYVQHMLDWATTNHVAYEIYFNADHSVITSGAFPQTAVAYRASIVRN